MPLHHLVHDPRIIEFIQKQYTEWIGGKPGREGTNQAPNPISLDHNHLSVLKENNYMVADKLDGVRYQLMLTMVPSGGGGVNGGDKPIAVFIDRSMRIYEIQVRTSLSHFRNGTLLDGELIKDHKWYAFDVWRIKGDTTIASLPLGERMTRYIALIGDGVITSACPNDITLHVKHHHPITMTRTVWRQRDRKLSDGLIFTPTIMPIGTGTHWLLFKYKEHHTIDFRIIASYCTSPESVARGDIPPPSSPPTATAIQPPTATPPSRWVFMIGYDNGGGQQGKFIDYVDGVYELVPEGMPIPTSTTPTVQEYIAECSVRFDTISRFIICTFIRNRPDKQVPNNLITIQRTLDNVVQGVPFAKLASIVC